MSVYRDTSVVLARLFAEDRSPPDAFWSPTLVASRLLEYEAFCRVHARGAAATHGDDARRLVDRVDRVEMSARVLGRAPRPFARPLRTRDALHLATMDFLRAHGQALALATYDQRLAAAAAAMGFELHPALARHRDPAATPGRVIRSPRSPAAAPRAAPASRPPAPASG